MKTQFEKIYVLSLITNKERQEFIIKQMNKLGLDFEFIYGTPFYKLSKDIIGNEIKYPQLYDHMFPGNSSATSYGCTISHFNAVAFAYELGYNNVLIIEDDICFLNDKKTIKHCLNNIPKDADFVTFDLRFLFDFQYYEFFDELDKKYKNINNHVYSNDKNIYININPKYGSLCGGMMYGLMNRETMLLYLSSQCNNLTISDRVNNIFSTNETDIYCINRYASKYCLGLGQYIIKDFFNENYENNCQGYKTVYKDICKLNLNDFYHPSKLSCMTRIFMNN